MNTKYKLGANTLIWSWPFTSQEFELLDKIKEIGFSVVEICISDPDDINTEFLAKKLTELELEPIICLEIDLQKDLTSNKSHIREKGIKYIKDCLEIAVKINARILGGPIHSADGKNNLIDDKQREIIYERSCESIYKIASRAKELGIFLGLEPMNRFCTNFINTTKQGKEIIKEVGIEGLGLLLDTYHMNIEEKNIYEAIILAGDLLYHIHAAENDRGTPGSGHFEWQELAEGLKEIDYSGSIAIEGFCPKLIENICIWNKEIETGDELAEEGFKFLNKLFQI